MEKEENIQLIPSGNQEMINSSGANEFLLQIRPYWQAKNLIQRVEKLLVVDPSSACQRIFNACIHDLKEKIIIAGLDIASEAAKQNRLPTISKQEDVENFSSTRILELAYYMGLLTRPEYRKLTRVYDIRKDLEHEDDEYEAGIEDCFYIFKTTIEIVLSRDPVHLLKLTDVKDIVENPTPVSLSNTVISDYKSAPIPRQLEIFKFLFYSVLNDKHPDIVRQNCYNSIYSLKEFTNKQVILELATDFTQKLDRKTPKLSEARVCNASGILPYLKKVNLIEFFKEFYSTMKMNSYGFKSYKQHGELLRNFREVGGLDYCPNEIISDILEWLVLCYIGEPSYGIYSSSRKVFYSNVGAPLALEIMEESQKDIFKIIKDLSKKSNQVKYAIQNPYVARRYQEIMDKIQE